MVSHLWAPAPNAARLTRTLSRCLSPVAGAVGCFATRRSARDPSMPRASMVNMRLERGGVEEAEEAAAAGTVLERRARFLEGGRVEGAFVVVADTVVVAAFAAACGVARLRDGGKLCDVFGLAAAAACACFLRASASRFCAAMTCANVRGAPAPPPLLAPPCRSRAAASLRRRASAAAARRKRRWCSCSAAASSVSSSRVTCSTN